MNPMGEVLDLTNRQLICLSLSPDGTEVVAGATDHALYAVDITGGKGARARREPKPRKVRTLYTKRHGHTEWVTCVAHTAAGAVLSGGMDGKLCLWPKGSTQTNYIGPRLP